MKRTILFAAMAMLSVGFTSCLKDGDKEILNNPIHVQGEFEPSFGVPLTNGQWNIDDILQMSGTNYETYLDMSSDVLTFIYDTTISGSMGSSPSSSGFNRIPHRRPHARSAKSGDETWLNKDTTMNFNINLNVYDDESMSTFFNSDFALDSVGLGITLFMQSICNDHEVDSILREFATTTIDNLQITYVDPNGYIRHLPAVSMETITLHQLLDGQTVHINGINLAEAVNNRARSINVFYRFHFEISNSIFAGDVATTPFDKLLNFTDNMTVDYNADIHLSIPLMTRLTNLSFNDTIEINKDDNASSGSGNNGNENDINLDSLLNGGLSLDLDSSFFTLMLENGLPLNISLSANLLDANGNLLTSLANNESIPAAQVSPMGIHNVYHATTPTPSTVRILLTKEQLDLFSSAKSIHLGFDLSTANGQYVAIKRSDLLRIKAKLLARVHAVLDVEIGETNN